MIESIIKIVETVKSKVTDDSDVIWAGYNSPKQLREELDGYIEQLKGNNTSCLEELRRHFLPTCTFQELSVSNGWPEEYLRLAERFDKIYYQQRNRSSDNHL